MKKVNIKDIFLYLLIFLIIVLVSVYLYYSYLKNTIKTIENFSPYFPQCENIDGEDYNSGQIDFNSNFYELTDTNSSNVLNGSNISRTSINYALGASNVCIYETNSSGTRVTDIECMTSGELQNALSLPQSRRDRVCIDEECLTKDDIKVLHGENPFQLKLRGDVMPTYDNKQNLNCLGRGIEDISACSDRPVSGGGPILKSMRCNNWSGGLNDKTEFYIDHSYFTRRDIDRLAINPLPNDPVSGSVSDSNSIQQLSDPEHR